MSFQVQPSIDGKIRKWFLGDGDPVSWRELLCIIDSIRIPGDTKFVLSPAAGTLHILVEEGEMVDENTVIATVKTSSILV